jgi:actin-related protein 2
MADRTGVCVVDNGTGFVKCGFAEETVPMVFPSMIGRPTMRYEEKIQGIELKDVMVGEDASTLRTMLQINYPVDKGIIRDWDEMRHIWDHTFNNILKINPKGSHVLLTEPPQNPISNRQKMLENMFEHYEFSGVYVATQAVMALYAQGIQSGCVLDAGEGVTHVICVKDSAILHESRLDVAGRSITAYLLQLLQARGYSFNKTSDFETVRQIKEKCCYVSCDLELDKKLGTETTTLTQNYTLPDGRVIKIGEERYAAPEALFDTARLDIEGGGITDLVFNALNKIDHDSRAELRQHIVLSGGTTMYPGLSTRLEKDLKAMYLREHFKGDTERFKRFKINIEDPPRRKHMVFLGASVLAGVMKTQSANAWVTKEMYEEVGVQACLAKLSH